MTCNYAGLGICPPPALILNSEPRARCFSQVDRNEISRSGLLTAMMYALSKLGCLMLFSLQGCCFHSAVASRSTSLCTRQHDQLLRLETSCSNWKHNFLEYATFTRVGMPARFSYRLNCWPRKGRWTWLESSCTLSPFAETVVFDTEVNGSLQSYYLVT